MVSNTMGVVREPSYKLAGMKVTASYTALSGTTLVGEVGDILLQLGKGSSPGLH